MGLGAEQNDMVIWFIARETEANKVTRAADGWGRGCLDHEGWKILYVCFHGYNTAVRVYAYRCLNRMYNLVTFQEKLSVHLQG